MIPKKRRGRVVVALWGHSTPVAEKRVVGFDAKRIDRNAPNIGGIHLNRLTGIVLSGSGYSDEAFRQVDHLYYRARFVSDGFDANDLVR